MNVPYTVKVPVDLAMSLRDRGDAIKRDLMDRMEALPKDDAAGRREIFEQVKHVTIQNLLRIALMTGFPAVSKLEDEDLIAKMMAGGVVRGRPRRAA